MNTRTKGQRTFRKAVKYALSFSGVTYTPIYQVSKFAQPQPYDMILFREDYFPRLIEVRSNQWGTGKPSTKQLSRIPGMVVKQIWMFKDGEDKPSIREWHSWEGDNGEWDGGWVRVDSAWEE